MKAEDGCDETINLSELEPTEIDYSLPAFLPAARCTGISLIQMMFTLTFHLSVIQNSLFYSHCTTHAPVRTGVCMQYIRDRN